MVTVAQPREELRRLRRFWEKVHKTSDCWLWIGSKSGPKKYGVFHLGRDGIIVYAHRFSYELANGPIPPGMLVCHRCDVPVCVRPDHLFLGTPGDNFQDMRAKGRHPHGTTHPMHKLNEGQVRAIRDLWATSDRSLAEIAQLYGVCFQLISQIVHRKIWTHVA